MRSVKVAPPKFSCDVCPRQFAKKKLLANHVENHTFNHRCEECDVNMANMVEVGKHRSALHKGVTFTRCTECKTGWMKESSLSAHKLQFHKVKDNKQNVLNVSDIKQILAAAPMENQPKTSVTDYEEVDLDDEDMEDSTPLTEVKFRDEHSSKKRSTGNSVESDSILNNSEDKFNYSITANGSNNSDLGLQSSISNEDNDHSKDRVLLKNKILLSLKKVMAGKSKDTISMTEDLKKLKEELEKSKATAREAQEKENSLINEIRRLKQQIQSNSETNDKEQNKIKKDLEQKQSEYEQLQKSKDEEILNLKVKMEKSQSRINKAKDLVTECLEYKKKCAELSKKFKETETDFLFNKKQLEEKTESLNNANQTINELRNTLGQLRNTMEKSNKEKIQVEQNLEVCKSLNAEKTEKLNSLQERLKKAEAGSDKRVGNVLQSLRAELDKLGSQNAKLREILKAKDEELLRHKQAAPSGGGGGVIRKLSQQNMPGPASKKLRR